MHSAQITQWGESPTYFDAPVPELPASESDLVQIKVQTTGLHQVVRSRATGTHYSAKTLPHVPGVDGVGITPSGQQVYFTTFAVGGSFSEIVNVPKADTAPLPQGVDPVQVAAAMNPMLSSWMALRKRTTNLPANFSVLILGATSASGRIGIDIARHLGAKRVVGVSRNLATLEKLGLDEVIQMRDPVTETDFSKLGHVDVILDYIYGPLAAHLLSSLKTVKPVQFVQIGVLGKLPMELPPAALRSVNLTIRGSGPGAWTMADLREELPGMAKATTAIGPLEVTTFKLEEMEKGWKYEGKDRVVFVV